MNQQKRKICVVVGSRANYGSIRSALRHINKHPNLELQLIVNTSAVIDRYGMVVDLIERDGFSVDIKMRNLVEGETPDTMAKSTGLALIELSTAFESLDPDVVLTVGDRFETMATALATTYLNRTLAHTMGGEVSGSIDESIRHAITKLAHVHFPASPGAQNRIIRLGERPENVHLVGCPRIDLVSEVLKKHEDGLPADLLNEGVGGIFRLDQPFVLVSQHPVTTEYGDGERQITETLMAVCDVGLAAIVLWPNADAGSEDVARGIRKFRERHDDSRIHFTKNFPADDYFLLMKHCACLVGNSSSALREGAFIGTPAVNLGSRQQARERGINIIDADHDRHAIAEAMHDRIAAGTFPSDPLYGDGQAGARIADVLAECQLDVQKQIAF